ncbi:MAG: thiol:disulfide interchange protein DsbA/DsbL [Nitrosomonas sp.]|nr:thiol:disulfide interchange protein DsbA/DsbL [Nitrosomonas sp.]
MIKQNFIFICLTLTLCWHSMALAEPGTREFFEGKDFQRIEPAIATQNEDDRIEIVELFLYACPHCNTLEHKLTNWAKEQSSHVSLTRMPAIVGDSWTVQARAYYTAEKLGILDTVHQALFKSIHEDGEQYRDVNAVKRFFVSQGVKPTDFIETYQSLEVDKKVNEARIMTDKYGIRGVPAIIVNGKYKTAQYLTGSQEKLLAVLDLLVEKERNIQK